MDSVYRALGNSNNIPKQRNIINAIFIHIEICRYYYFFLSKSKILGFFFFLIKVVKNFFRLFQILLYAKVLF